MRATMLLEVEVTVEATQEAMRAARGRRPPEAASQTRQEPRMHAHTRDTGLGSGMAEVTTATRSSGNAGAGAEIRRPKRRPGPRCIPYPDGLADSGRRINLCPID